MTDLDRIAEERRRLKDRLAELDIAERVLLSFQGGRTPRGRKPDQSGLPAQYASVVAILNDNGGTMLRTDLLAAINDGRSQAMPETTHSALLSKMATAGLIVRTDGHVSIVRKDDESS